MTTPTIITRQQRQDGIVFLAALRMGYSNDMAVDLLTRFQDTRRKIATDYPVSTAVSPFDRSTADAATLRRAEQERAARREREVAGAVENVK